MDKIEIVEVETMGEVTQHVIIDRGNGEFTSMPKAVWDELEAAKENGTIS
jgi:acyl-CoA thioesterase FadM